MVPKNLSLAVHPDIAMGTAEPKDEGSLCKFTTICKRHCLKTLEACACAAFPDTRAFIEAVSRCHTVAQCIKYDAHAAEGIKADR